MRYTTVNNSISFIYLQMIGWGSQGRANPQPIVSVLFIISLFLYSYFELFVYLLLKRGGREVGPRAQKPKSSNTRKTPIFYE